MRKLAGEYLNYVRFNKEELLILTKHYPKRYQAVQKGVRKDFDMDLEELGADLILDHFYGLDLVVDLETESGEVIRVGIDVTVNPNEVQKKLDKGSQEIKGLLQDLGIQRFLVVLYQVEKPYNQESKNDSLSSGERTGKSLNRWFRPSGLWDSNVDQGH